MEETPENGKELSNSAHANGMNEYTSWKNCINNILPELSSSCFAVSSLCSYSNTSTFKMIYFAYLHTTVENGITFGGTQ